jgi:hypothetical protein
MVRSLYERAIQATGLEPDDFATLLGVPSADVAAWALGEKPTGAARSLLKLVEMHPKLARRTLNREAKTTRIRREDREL